MLGIDCFASGSSGNLYRVDDSRTRILIECGVSLKEIQNHLGFSLSACAACLVTHEHKDHSKALPTDYWAIHPDQRQRAFLCIRALASQSALIQPLLTILSRICVRALLRMHLVAQAALVDLFGEQQRIRAGRRERTASGHGCDNG